MTRRFMTTEAHPLPEDWSDEDSTPPLGRVRNIALLASLGKGGMGEVFIGEDEVLGRRVAVKCIRPGLLGSQVARNRFLREARMLSQLEHPNICRVYDFITTSRGDFLVMELVEGRSLDQAASDLELAAKLELVMQIAKALTAAHQQGIVHRDLKPQNVMITGQGEAKVLDFGLARRWDTEAMEAGPHDRPVTAAGGSFETEVGLIMGSPPYMSPEQARGEPLTPGSDLYSLGILLQELAEGVRAYDGLRLPSLLFKVQLGDARPMVAGDSDLVDLVQKLKSLDPRERPSAQAVHDRLRWILDKPRRRRRRLIAAVISLAAFLGAIKYAVDLRRERQVAIEAQRRAETLIDFMVDDLYRGLEPLGRLDLLEAAADAASGYYDEFGSAGGDAEEWFRRAWALRNSGRVLEYQGRYEKASSAYRQSVASLSGLIEAHGDHPESGEWRRVHADAVALSGRALQEQGKLAESLEMHGRSLQLRRELEQDASPEHREPRRLERQKEQAEIAWLLREMGRHEEALGELDALLVEARGVPGDQRRFISVILTYRGTIEFERGNYPRALEDFNQARGLDEELWRLSSDPGRQLDILMTTSRIGETLSQMERTAEAIEAFRHARDLGLDLVARDPLNADWKRELGVAHTNLAAAWRIDGRFAESLKASEAALELSRELLDGDPSNASYRNDVAADLTAVGIAHEGLGQGAKAASAWQEAVQLLAPAVADPAEASSFYLASLAQALLRLGRLDEAREPLALLASRGWQDPELASLARDLGMDQDLGLDQGLGLDQDLGLGQDLGLDQNLGLDPPGSPPAGTGVDSSADRGASDSTSDGGSP